MIDGLAVVDKPAGMTSHDVVGRCRRIFGQRRVGHAGTLDPDATGVLLVGLGRATRLLHFMAGLDKSYRAGIQLGVATNTLDAAGTETGRWDMSGVTLEKVQAAAAGLTGPQMQTPPMVSAVKVGGKRLHELARAGLEVPRQPRGIDVHEFSVESLEMGLVKATIVCSSGTYVRVLAENLGQALGGGAHVATLRRTAVGPWTDSESVGLDALGPGSVLPPSAALPWLSATSVPVDVAQDVGHGKVLDRVALGVDGEGPWRVVGPTGDLIAVYVSHSAGRAKPAVVLPPA